MTAQPNVVNTLEDPSNKRTFRILAYRALTRNEMLMAVAAHNGSKPGKGKPKAGTVTILTIIGFDGG